ncbi:hypothetical protein ACIF6L_26170 [Kitasatospora sp. NPDC086009]|uniref:hypothetical protein n=1 Tax=unclassified Kitasatospora TaxID=2633591 RepID=UPI0037C782C0
MSMQTIDRPVALRAALQLYPARYRRERGEELAAVFADTTAEADRPTLLREALDLAAYGLRMRARLTSASAAGRLLALAVPLVAGTAAGAALYPWVSDPDLIAWRIQGAHSSVLLALTVFALPVASLLLAVAAVLGHWTAARVLSIGVVGAGLLNLADSVLGAGSVTWWWFSYSSTSALPFVLSGLLVLAAPGDLLGRPTWRTAALVPLGAVGGLLVVTAQGGWDTRYLMNDPWAALLLVVPLLLVCAAARGWLVPAAIGLAVLPLTLSFSLFSLWESAGGIWNLLGVGAVGAAFVAVAGIGWRGIEGLRRSAL